MKIISLSLLVASALSFSAELTLRQIMADPTWMGQLPEAVAFGSDALYFKTRQPVPLPDKWLKLNPADGEVSEPEPADMPYLLTTRSFTQGDLTLREVDGDLWYSKAAGPLTPLISRSDRLHFVRFRDDHSFVYSERQNLFSFDLLSGQTLQLTDLRLEDKPDEKKEYYRETEKHLFDYVANLYRLDDYREKDGAARRQMGVLTRPEPAWLGADLALGESWVDEDNRFVIDISPDETWLTVIVKPKQDEPQTEYAEFVNKEGRVRAVKARPKVGEPTPGWKMCVVRRDSGAVRWLDFSTLPEIETDRLADITAALSEEDKAFLPEKKQGPRPLMLVPGGFHPDGKHILITAFSRDYKDRWVLLAQADGESIEVLDHRYDPAWTQHLVRNIGTDVYTSGAAFWGPSGDSVHFLSDESGYQHLYGYELNRKKRVALTAGDFEVHSPFVGPQGKYWYFHSNRTHPGEMQFYRMPLAGGAWTALTPETGFHLVSLATDGRMADLFSLPDRPSVIRLAASDGVWQTLYDGRSEDFRSIEWIQPEILTYRNRDGKPVYARLYKPNHPNGAGIVFVHGAGYLQNAHKGWSDYFREYMFHNLLAREGYTVLDPDYSASAGYGRDWRTAIYRHMGGRDLADVVDGARYLVTEHALDPSRLGVYGGSYGGFITFMAMFTEPDVFKSGAALRPVADWAYYNHWYTARILNTPQCDPESYRRSSPIYFAEGLKGNLLICHGMVDSNVPFHDVVRLSQRLIELGKENWELAPFPVEGHGFNTPSGWFDEYRRIKQLFDTTLR